MPGRIGTMTAIALGNPIPDIAHAVSVSLPTWKANVAYEKGEQWVIGEMATGYPRFFIHRSILALAQDIVDRHGSSVQHALLFPSSKSAERCIEFAKERVQCLEDDLWQLDLSIDQSRDLPPTLRRLSPTISAVVFSSNLLSTVKQYWQHTGDGCSSRRAEFCHDLFKNNFLVPITSQVTSPPLDRAKACRGPKRYLRQPTVDTQTTEAQTTHGNQETQDSLRFVEERFGRNLDLSMVKRATSAIKRRIAGAVSGDEDPTVNTSQEIGVNVRGLESLGEDDVYLFPCGMNAIYYAHRALLQIRGQLKSINFGFPYVDTLKILEKFGPGCELFSHASAEDIDRLEARLNRGDRFLALFCEFPGNPLLTCPDLVRIRLLADKFDFAVVIDETIGTIANVNVIQFADIVVSSLTKIFSGDCNVMGGAAILNPNSSHYQRIKMVMDDIYEDNYWPEDVVFMERNSRDYRSRIAKVNKNSEAICDVLIQSPAVKRVYFPKHNPTRHNYDVCRLPGGGYGGLLSVTFYHEAQAMSFFDAVETAKGPSLGTNFTLTSPYVILAHYQELDWAASLGVDPSLVRVSVGLEDTESLCNAFRWALETAEKVATY